MLTITAQGTTLLLLPIGFTVPRSKHYCTGSPPMPDTTTLQLLAKTSRNRILSLVSSSAVEAAVQKAAECVIKATKLILSLRNIAKEAIIWYDVCLVRYSDRRFFSTKGGVLGHYKITLWDMLNDLRIEAAKASTKSAEKSVKITDNKKLYGFAWCIQYLSEEDCSNWCISNAIEVVLTGCCS